MPDVDPQSESAVLRHEVAVAPSAAAGGEGAEDWQLFAHNNTGSASSSKKATHLVASPVIRLAAKWVANGLNLNIP
jgi:hypothetical protein